MGHLKATHRLHISSTMRSLFIVAVCLLGSCYCIDLKPYNETALMMFHGEDTNGDGMITRIELEQLFDKYDANGNGKESRHEYTEFVCATTPTLYNLAHYLFDEYDANGDHMLEKADYDALFMKMNPDNDDSIEEDEFVAYWTTIFMKYENINTHSQTHQHGQSACH